MTELKRWAASEARLDEVLEVLDHEGGLILENALPREKVAAILEELEPHIAATAPIDDAFVGRATTRTGALVARSRTAREAITHPKVLEVVQAFLSRHARGVQLNLTQIMRLLPGQDAQPLHRDRYIWSRQLPREIEPQANCMWALSPFTDANGATRIIPGSQRWDWDREPSAKETIPAEMEPGSLLLYTGSVVHGGGANRSDAPRIGMNITYLLDWLRQEENQYLACPPEVARDLPPELQRLIGYTVGNGALGYYSTPGASPGGIPDILPPEAAVGAEASFAEQTPF